MGIHLRPGVECEASISDLAASLPIIISSRHNWTMSLRADTRSPAGREKRFSRLASAPQSEPEVSFFQNGILRMYQVDLGFSLDHRADQTGQ